MVMIHLFRELQAYLEIGNGKDGGILLINSITYSNRVNDFLNCAILLVIACSSQKGLWCFANPDTCIQRQKRMKIDPCNSISPSFLRVWLASFSIFAYRFPDSQHGAPLWWWWWKCCLSKHFIEAQFIWKSSLVVSSIHEFYFEFNNTLSCYFTFFSFFCSFNFANLELDLVFRKIAKTNSVHYLLIWNKISILKPLLLVLAGKRSQAQRNQLDHFNQTSVPPVRRNTKQTASASGQVSWKNTWTWPSNRLHKPSKGNVYHISWDGMSLFKFFSWLKIIFTFPVTVGTIFASVILIAKNPGKSFMVWLG